MIASQGPIGSFRTKSKNQTIHIYGAGICGLLFAYFLKKKNYKVKIHEKSATTGGKIQTLRSENGLVETGANAIYTSPDVIQLLNELKISYVQIKPQLRKLIFRRKPQSFPLSLIEIIKIFLKLRKRVPQRSNISVYDFFVPLLGKKVANEVLSCALNGIYATDIKKLHFHSIFKYETKNKSYFSLLKEMKKRKKDFKATSVSFEGGMSELIERLERELEGSIQLNSKKEIDSFENNIVCTDAFDASVLLNEKFPILSKHLEGVSYNKVSTTTTFTSKTIAYLENSFGILFPYNEDKALGIINNSALFDNRAKDNMNSYTFISKSESTDFINEFINEGFSVKTFWQRAFPVYDTDRYKSVAKLRADFFNIPNNLIIFGNYVDGISIREMIGHIKSYTEDF